MKPKKKNLLNQIAEKHLDKLAEKERGKQDTLPEQDPQAAAPEHPDGNLLPAEPSDQPALHVHIHLAKHKGKKK